MNSINIIKNLVTFLFFFFQLLFCSIPLKATHLLGGHITVDQYSSQNYILNLDLFWDPNLVETDSQTIHVFQRSNASFVDSFKIFLVSVDTINPDIRCNPFNSPQTYYHSKYSDTIFLSAGTYTHPSGYLFTFERCCREDLNNMIGSSIEKQTIVTFFTPTENLGGQLWNRSPVPTRSTPLTTVSCVYEQYRDNFDFIDPDGDSLSFSLYNPFNLSQVLPGVTSPISPIYPDPSTQFVKINWSNPYSATDQISGPGPDPSPDRFEIDSITGEMTVIAEVPPPGYFLTGIWCQEWRDINNDGIKDLIGSVFRDFTIFVADCQDTTINNNVILNITSIPYQTCEDTIELFTNYSNNQNFNINWYFQNPNGSAFSTADTVSISVDGWYYVKVDDPKIHCDSGYAKVFIDFQGEQTSISSSGPTTLNCASNDDANPTITSLSLNNGATYNSHAFQWYYSYNGVTSTVPNGSTSSLIDIGFPGDFFLITTNTSTGCSDTSNIITISANGYSGSFTLSMTGDTLICDGNAIANSLVISPSIGQPVPSSPLWTFEVYNGSTFIGNNLNTIPSDGDYWVIITNPFGCTYFTDTVSVNVDTLPVPNDNIGLIQPFNDNGIYCSGDTVTLRNYDYPNNAIHSLFINGVFQGNIFTNSAIHYIIPPYIGMNDISVVSTFGNDCFDTLFEYSAFVLNEVCCTNLDSLKLLFGILDSTINYNQKYLVIDDLFTQSGGNYWLEGEFYFMGKAIKDPDIFGGEATGPNLYLADSSISVFNGAMLLAFCDTMWGGVFLENTAELGVENTLIQDSYFGIRPNVADFNDVPSNNEYYKMVGTDNTFHNNYVSITCYANLRGVNSAIFGNFSCDPETMLFPFDYSSNGEIYSYSYKAIDLYQGNGYSFNNLSDNLNWTYGTNSITSAAGRISISDHVYGVYLNQETIIDTIAAITILRPVVAGIYSKSKARELVLGYDTIYVQSDPIYENWQFEFENSNNPYLNNKTYGVISEEREIVLEQSLIYGDESSFAIGSARNISVGLKSNMDAVIRANYFSGLDFALQSAKGRINFDLDSNTISRNVIGIHITDFARVDLDLNCNQFIKHPNDRLTQYGIFVDERSGISDDIGGNQTFSNPDQPAANGWPVDSILSTGYPFTTTGDPGFPDVFLWSPPQNWYSIFDANATGESHNLGYKYHRWNNEFIGEEQSQSNWNVDAVYPSAIIDPYSSNTVTGPCSNSPGIIYPMQIVLGDENNFENSDIRLFPVPTKSELVISGLSENENKLFIFDLTGRKVLETQINNNEKVNLSQFNSGVYIVKLLNAKGVILKQQQIIKK